MGLPSSWNPACLALFLGIRGTSLNQHPRAEGATGREAEPEPFGEVGEVGEVGEAAPPNEARLGGSQGPGRSRAGQNVPLIAGKPTAAAQHQSWGSGEGVKAKTGVVPI